MTNEIFPFYCLIILKSINSYFNKYSKKDYFILKLIVKDGYRIIQIFPDFISHILRYLKMIPVF